MMRKENFKSELLASHSMPMMKMLEAISKKTVETLSMFTC